MKDFLRSRNIKISYCSFDEKDLKRRPLSLHTDFAKPGWHLLSLLCSLSGRYLQNLHIAGADSTAFRRLSLWLVPHAVIQKVRLFCVIFIIHFIARRLEKRQVSSVG
jgi:hypothetical protein